VILPSPVERRLDAADVQRLRNAKGPPNVMRGLAIVVIVSSIFSVAGNIGRQRYLPGWLEATEAVFLMWLVVLNVRVLFRRQASFEIGDSWIISFDDDAIYSTHGLVGSKVVRKRIQLRSIRSVTLTSERLLIVVTGAPLVDMPRQALVDGGDAVMRYFRERLVGDRLLVSSGDSTTIRNTRDFRRGPRTHA